MANISTPLQHCNIIESCVPLQSTSGTNLKPKWMTRRVRNRIREKEDAWIRYRQRRSRARYATYCRKRNYATSAVKEAKYNFEKKLSDEVKTNPRAFYAYARSKTRIKEEVLQLKHPDGSLTDPTRDLHPAQSRIPESFH
ncbi:hypothetical protein Pcinc_019464 [Petrolisthes cinctipes]|uniref:Uncharacterized protein n=1 Tax=Petrolisthes cinctipes TaxID=88211 RepID=A0AAE1KMN3_PETCI|nr:hypothetical protein Pcinc_019464 [Petrolisthes cinctipes]